VTSCSLTKAVRLIDSALHRFSDFTHPDQSKAPLESEVSGTCQAAVFSIGVAVRVEQTVADTPDD
jgi:hypothetical protein